MNISIAMCVRNGELHLQEQLDSIAGQTRLPNELIICDDQSSDSTCSVIETFATRAPFAVRLMVNERRLGTTKNFERAIKLCNGNVITLSDQDDVWSPSKLARIEAALLARPDAGLVFTNAEVVNQNLVPLGYTLWESCRFTRAQQKMVKRGKAFEVMLVQCVVAGGVMAFRSEFRDLVLPIPCISRLVHDMWIACLISAVANVAILDEPLSKYRQHPKQQIGARKVGIRESITTARKTDATVYLIEAERFERLHERLLSFGKTRRTRISRVEGKLAHLRARANMPARRLSRLPLVLKEMLTLHYHRYSRGLLSAAKDLFMADAYSHAPDNAVRR
jgi:glycosyltransferase involved in cell wall biosynthesis